MALQLLDFKQILTKAVGAKGNPPQTFGNGTGKAAPGATEAEPTTGNAPPS